jgi:transposase
MTILDVACHLNVGWHLIKVIQKRYLKNRFCRPKLSGIRQIAIDEISTGKSQKYLMVVLDLLRRAVVFVGDANGAGALQPFWRRLKRSQTRIAAAATGMCHAFIGAVRENLPAARIVFDHFHMIKLFNDELQEFRRRLFNQAQSTIEKKVLKGTRWLLLKNSENRVKNTMKLSGCNRLSSSTMRWPQSTT